MRHHWWDKIAGAVEGFAAGLTLPPRVRRQPFNETRQMAERWSDTEAAPDEAQRRRAEAALGAVEWVARTPVVRRRLTCLPLSLLRLRYLRRLGIEARLHLGLVQRDGEWSGHAWVTAAGEPIGERPDSLAGFTEMLVIPREPTENRGA